MAPPRPGTCLPGRQVNGFRDHRRDASPAPPALSAGTPARGERVHPRWHLPPRRSRGGGTGPPVTGSAGDEGTRTLRSRTCRSVAFQSPKGTTTKRPARGETEAWRSQAFASGLTEPGLSLRSKACTHPPAQSGGAPLPPSGELAALQQPALPRPASHATAPRACGASDAGCFVRTPNDWTCPGTSRAATLR